MSEPNILSTEDDRLNGGVGLDSVLSMEDDRLSGGFLDGHSASLEPNIPSTEDDRLRDGLESFFEPKRPSTDDERLSGGFRVCAGTGLDDSGLEEPNSLSSEVVRRSGALCCVVRGSPPRFAS